MSNTESIPTQAYKIDNQLPIKGTPKKHVEAGMPSIHSNAVAKHPVAIAPGPFDNPGYGINSKPFFRGVPEKLPEIDYAKFHSMDIADAGKNTQKFSKLNQMFLPVQNPVEKSYDIGNSSVSEISSKNFNLFSVANEKGCKTLIDIDGNGKFDRMIVSKRKGMPDTYALDESKFNVKTFEKNYINNLYKEENKKTSAHLHIDKKIETSKQGRVGDCWNLAGINAISYTKNGAKAIHNNIVKDKNGDISVKLPGEQKTYKFTPLEIKDATKLLSKGDDDARVIEMASASNRISKLKKISTINSLIPAASSSSYKIKNPYEILNGGMSSEVVYALTGKKGLPIYNPRAFNQTKSNPQAEKNIGKCMSLIQKNPERYCATAIFLMDKHDISKGTHAFSVKRVDKEGITIVNPWNSGKEIKMPKKEFYKNCLNIEFFDMGN